MLLSLYIENIALIQKLNIEFSEGLTVFTGETGAGKTIIVGTLSLLCGARGDKDIIRTGESFALAEGVFGELREQELLELSGLGIEPDDDGMIMLSRRLNADGKSNCRINGRTVPLSLLKGVGGCLMGLHGQQESMKLADPDTHLPLLDGFACNRDVLEDYKNAYSVWCSEKKKLDELEKTVSDSQDKADMLDFQINELSAVKPKNGEYAKLEEESLKLSNFEKISENSQKAHDALYSAPSAYELINKAKAAIKRIEGVIPQGAELVARLDSCSLEIADIADTLSEYAGGDGENVSAKLDKIEGRIAELKRLERKYRVSADELESRLEQLKEERALIENAEGLTQDQKKAVLEAESVLSAKAKALTENRRQKSRELCDKVKEQLNDLDMPSVGFDTKFEHKAFCADGCDSVEFLIAPNKGEQPKPMSKIASGGELSRIMLSVKSALSMDKGVGCGVFDEIDTGISGKTSEKIGIKLKQLATDGAQVLCVTHSAQIAALADTHLLVAKKQQEGRTYTCVTPLDLEGRVGEVARIMGGISITDSVIAAARESIMKNR